MHTKSFVLATCLAAAGCAHSPAHERTPANVESRAEDPTATMFRDAAVAKAFLLGEANARGERQPLCQFSVRQHQELVPHFTTFAEDTYDETFGLKECSLAQLDQIAKVAALSHRPLVADATGTVLSCAFDFALAVILTPRIRQNLTTAKNSAELVDRGARTAAAALPAVAASAAVKLYSTGHAPVLITTVCAGIGGAVGYWFVPKAKPKL